MFCGVGALFGLIVTAGLIAGGIGLLALLARGGGAALSGLRLPGLGSASQASPREALQERYARGEITREQYLETLANLG